jgi:hypothetical protein
LPSQPSVGKRESGSFEPLVIILLIQTAPILCRRSRRLVRPTSRARQQSGRSIRTCLLRSVLRAAPRYRRSHPQVTTHLRRSPCRFDRSGQAARKEGRERVRDSSRTSQAISQKASRENSRSGSMPTRGNSPIPIRPERSTSEPTSPFTPRRCRICSYARRDGQLRHPG